MSKMSDRLNELKGENRFKELQLEEIFNEEELEEIERIREIILNANNDNEASAKIQGAGTKTILALVKLARQSLT